LTFIPLDSVESKPVNEGFRQLGGSAKLAIDLLDFEQAYLKGFLFVCGNSMICDTIAEAKQLAYAKKVDLCSLRCC